MPNELPGVPLSSGFTYADDAPRPRSYCVDPLCFQEGDTHLHEPNRPKVSEKERLRREVAYLRQRVQELEASEERLAERIEVLESGEGKG